METISIVVGEVTVDMDKEEVSKAIEAGKIEVKSDDLITYKKENFETFKANLANEEYKKGKVAGEEMTIKTGREKYGLEFEGKTIDNFADALKIKIEADVNKKPTEKITELETDKKKLQGNLSELQTQFDTFKTTITEKETRSKKDSSLLELLPAQGLAVSNKIAILALKDAGIDVSFDDAGKRVITKDGEIQKNPTTLEPIDGKPFITDQLSALNLIGSNNNNNNNNRGDDTGDAKAGTYEAFVKEMSDQNINSGSLKFAEEMNKRQKEGTLKV